MYLVSSFSRRNHNSNIHGGNVLLLRISKEAHSLELPLVPRANQQQEKFSFSQDPTPGSRSLLISSLTISSTKMSNRRARSKLIKTISEVHKKSSWLKWLISLYKFVGAMVTEFTHNPDNKKHQCSYQDLRSWWSAQYSKRLTLIRAAWRVLQVSFTFFLCLYFNSWIHTRNLKFLLQIRLYD